MLVLEVLVKTVMFLPGWWPMALNKSSLSHGPGSQGMRTYLSLR